MKIRTSLLIVLFGFVLFFTNCKEKNRFKIDLKSNYIETTVARFDKSLINLDTTSLATELQRLQEEYPDFYPAFVDQVLGFSPKDTLQMKEQIFDFLTNPIFRKVNADVLERFNDIAAFEKSLSTAYSYIHHYFPDIVLPKLYFFVSGFNDAFLSNHKFCGLGVDLYLGADYPLYEGISYRYMRENMKPEALLPDFLSALLLKEFPKADDKDRFLDQMIYQGKILFLLSVIMPDSAEEQLIGYSMEQIRWSKKHEADIWAVVVDQKHLFSTDNMLKQQYFNDAPFTAPVSQDSPGRLGLWLGGQIVKSYMNNNRELGLQDLMNQRNSDEILKRSGYRP